MFVFEKSVDLEVIHWSAEDREQFTAFFDENLANGLIFDYLRKCGLLEPGKKMEVSLLLHALICFYLKKVKSFSEAFYLELRSSFISELLKTISHTRF